MVGDLAEVLDIEPMWVGILIRKGVIKARKVGSYWFVTKRDLRTMMRQWAKEGNTKYVNTYIT